MKLLGTLAGAVLAAGIFLGTAAQAADVAPRRGVYVDKAPAATLFDWTGLYLGGHAGYSKQKFEAGGLDDSPAGASVGVQGGYRWQFGNFVPGIEVDITAGDVSGNTATVVTDSARLWGSARATLGYAALGFMPYATAGYAWQRGEVGVLGFTDTQMHGGWVYGGGVASPITKNLIAKVEFLHYEFGDQTYTIPLGSAKVSSTMNEIRAGLEYKF